MLDRIAVGNKISFLRKQKGFTQEELASKLVISAQAISKWENGHTIPETALLPALAKFLGSSIDSVLIPKHENLIESIEEISKIEKSKFKKMIEKTVNITTIVKAAKGVSPVPEDQGSGNAERSDIKNYTRASYQKQRPNEKWDGISVHNFIFHFFYQGILPGKYPDYKFH